MDDLNGYFREQTNKRLESIEVKLDVLLKSRWMILGGAAVVGTIASLLITLMFGRV